MSAHSSSSRAALLAGRAAALRSALTLSEARRWESLRGSRLGVGFRRQLVIGRYIVDFAAPSCRLVVEVDGGYHVARAVADARRDRDLGRLGWRVLRVSDHAVLHEHEAVLVLIRAALVA